MTQQPIYMPEEMAKDLKDAANRDGVSLNVFCRTILEDYMRRKAKVVVEARVEFPKGVSSSERVPGPQQPVRVAGVHRTGEGVAAKLAKAVVETEKKSPPPKT